MRRDIAPHLAPLVVWTAWLMTALAWPRIVDRAVCGWWRVGGKA